MRDRVPLPDNDGAAFEEVQSQVCGWPVVCDGKEGQDSSAEPAHSVMVIELPLMKRGAPLRFGHCEQDYAVFAGLGGEI
jgi:hypothetical protein